MFHIIFWKTFVSLDQDWSSSFTCPCGPLKEITDTKGNGKRTICIQGLADRILRFQNVNIDYLNSYHNYTFLTIQIDAKIPMSCDVLIRLVDDKKNHHRRICPGICRPIPHVDISWEWLIHSQDKATAITCSLTFQMWHRSLPAGSNRTSTAYMTSLLSAVADRRILECNEQSSWSIDGSHNNIRAVDRRRVYGLAIWVGSVSRRQVSEHQQKVLQSEPFHGRQAVVGWSADDDLFPCRNGSTRCRTADKRGNFKQYMPLTQLGDERCEFGWACAQRRPLRALAHCLLLFDPDFLFLGDDDTYLNYALLQRKLGQFIRVNMTRDSFIIGNFLNPRPGQLSPRGFFLGGAGYLMGRAVLEKLVAKEVLSQPPPPTTPLSRTSKAERFSSQQFASHLSLLRDAKSAADIACPEGCIDMTQTSQSSQSSDGSTQGSASVSVPIGVRLVDLCTHLLAGEHTCHHSDHSLSRCLFYGLPSLPMGLPCAFEATAQQLRERVPFMCGHIWPCNISSHLTCHRYKPSAADSGRGRDSGDSNGNGSDDDISPVRTYLTASNASEWTGCLPPGDKKIWRH
eukprot:gene4683-9280_t